MKDQEGFNRETLSDVQGERTHLKAKLLRASNELAELRKRWGEESYWCEREAESLKRTIQGMADERTAGKVYAYETVARRLASPPSPAPVESKPKKCSGCGCLETAPHFSDCSGEVKYE